MFCFSHTQQPSALKTAQLRREEYAPTVSNLLGIKWTPKKNQQSQIFCLHYASFSILSFGRGHLKSFAEWQPTRQVCADDPHIRVSWPHVLIRPQTHIAHRFVDIFESQRSTNSIYTTHSCLLGHPSPPILWFHYFCNNTLPFSGKARCFWLLFAHQMVMKLFPFYH